MASPPELRIVIAGGGTGGHLFPGIAVARELLSRRPDVKVSFAGTSSGIEARVIPREGFPLDVIRSAGLKGKSLAHRARGVALVPLGVVDAWRLLSARRPHLVVGVGGYSSGPVVLMAAFRGIATMLLEQNAIPGLTNRLLAPIVRAAAVTFDSTVPFFGSKAFVSGNPVRAEFLNTLGPGDSRSTDDRAVANVLVAGGSQGAHAINMAMVEALPELATHGARIRVTHQTGDNDVVQVRAAYGQAGMEADVEPFFYDMGRRLSSADLVVSRAGATALAELAAAGTPAILIPLPTATDDHQRKNAEAVAAAGAAEVLLQDEATGPALARRIVALIDDRGARIRMGAAARRLARPDAARVIVDRALELARS
jgi:UDP-N-acetylglucosamine--N-acetylmuramyl-(pentapeptide) pyrophosphoryl-undecaprenol N-acetylglucosamine transferase